MTDALLLRYGGLFLCLSSQPIPVYVSAVVRFWWSWIELGWMEITHNLVDAFIVSAPGLLASSLALGMPAPFGYALGLVH